MDSVGAGIVEMFNTTVFIFLYRLCVSLQGVHPHFEIFFTTKRGLFTTYRIRQNSFYDII